MILVLGASGYIGNNLYNNFLREGFNVVGTYFKNKKSDLVYFDSKKLICKKFTIQLREIFFFNTTKKHCIAS